MDLLEIKPNHILDLRMKLNLNVESFFLKPKQLLVLTFSFLYFDCLTTRLSIYVTVGMDRTSSAPNILSTV